MKHILEFLDNLSDNNNREWFAIHKPEFELCKKEMLDFVAKAIVDMSTIDSTIKNLEPKNCVFRIYRDTRFSLDKIPYKTNFGAFLSPGGSKSYLPGYYLHIEPGQSFISAGVYMPPADTLKAIRTEIYHNADELKLILANPESQKYFTALADDDKLKNVPRGFPKDFKDADLLKHKHFYVHSPLSNAEITSENFYANVIAAWTQMKPLLEFLRNAIDA